MLSVGGCCESTRGALVVGDSSGGPCSLPPSFLLRSFCKDLESCGKISSSSVVRVGVILRSLGSPAPLGNSLVGEGSVRLGALSRDTSGGGALCVAGDGLST